MTTRVANFITIIGGVASVVIILGLFGVDAKFVQQQIEGMPIRALLLVGALLVLLVGLYFKRQRASITPENVELKVRQWGDAFGLGTTKISDPAFYFGFQVRLPNNLPLTIFRTKDHPHYLTLFARVTLDPEHKASYEKLSELQRGELIHKLQLELARAKVSCAIDFSSSTTIEKMVPITQTLTEAELMNAIQEVQFGMVLFSAAVALALKGTETSS